MGFKMNAPDPGILPVGVHLMRIAKVEDNFKGKPFVSAKGDPYWRVTLEAVDNHEQTAEDVFMLGGRGRGMTKKKLELLGFPENADVETYALRGLCCYCSILHDEYKGEMRAKVDGSADGSTFGYWSEMSPPAGFDVANSEASNLFGEKEPTKPVDETPF